MSRTSALAVRSLAVLALVAPVTVGASASASPVATAAKTCKPPKYPDVGYFTSLTVTGTGCSTGSKVALAYYKCRTKGGHKNGRCHSNVDGYKCSEVRNSIPTEIDARVTCKKGHVKIVHTYQQDL